MVYMFPAMIISNIFQFQERGDHTGLILASSSKSVFCAGLDFAELHDPSEIRQVQQDLDGFFGARSIGTHS
jgi:enoyl-CoA hydratase/carnithine racemase